eukprot:6082187-Prymnesium_polylepis.1
MLVELGRVAMASSHSAVQRPVAPAGGVASPTDLPWQMATSFLKATSVGRDCARSEAIPLRLPGSSITQA